MQARRWRLLPVLAMALAALALGVGAAADVGSGSGPPTSIGHGGAAASVERIATQAAVDTLKKGGNAIDAAVALPPFFIVSLSAFKPERHTAGLHAACNHVCRVVLAETQP